MQWSRKLSGKWLVSLLFLAVSLSMLYPLYITIVLSMKTVPDYQRNKVGLPRHWTLSNFSHAWTQGHMGRYTVNSVIVVALALVILIVAAVPAGYAFAQFSFPFRRTLLGGIVAFAIVSPGLQIVPVFKLATELHFINSYLGLALIYAAFSVPFGVYLMSAYFEGVPRAIFEAGIVDGAGVFSRFLRLAVPIARPGLLTLITFAFLTFWNEFIFALFILLDPNKRTLTAGVARLHDDVYTSQPLLAAGLVFTMVPCVLVFALLQRNLNEGLTAGATKE